MACALLVVYVLAFFSYIPAFTADDSADTVVAPAADQAADQPAEATTAPPPAIVPNLKNEDGVKVASGDTVGYSIIHQDLTGSQNLNLVCEGKKEDRDKLFWKRNGVEVNGIVFENQWDETMTNTHELMNSDDAHYECNGISFNYVNIPASTGPQELSIWQGSPILCIDQELGKGRRELTNEDKSAMVEAKLSTTGFRLFWKIVKHNVDNTMTIKCNGTEEFTFKSETVPTTTLEFKSKELTCTSSDPEGRCLLQIFVKGNLVAQAKAASVIYKYKSINIAQVTCEAKCDIGDESITLPVQQIEVNRTLFIIVIFIIILIILILIILVCCVLWHKFGLKEKYGYQINMRLNKQFSVGDNKLSSYRLSGVQPDGPIEEEGAAGSAEGGDVTKEFRDFDEGSVVDEDSFTDPNFARGNGEKDIDYESKGTDVEVKQPDRSFPRIGGFY